MKQFRSSLYIVASAIFMASLISGCQDYNGGTSYQELSQILQNEEYASNFIAEYGDLSQVKSWDLSSLGEQLNYMGNETRTATKNFSDLLEDGVSHYVYAPLSGCTNGTASDICETSTLNTTIASATQSNATYYYLPDQTFTWLTTNMTESIEHTSTDIGNRSKKKGIKKYAEADAIPGAGHNFKMKEPESDFWMIPIYQGVAASTYELHLVMNNVDYKVWTKGQGLEIEQYLYDYSTIVEYVDAETNETKTYRKTFATDIVDNKRNYLSGTKDIKYNIKEQETKTQRSDGKWEHVVTYYVDQDNDNVIGRTTIIKNGSGKYTDFSISTELQDVQVVRNGSKWEDLQTNNRQTNIYWNTLKTQDQYAQAVRSKPIHFKKEAFEGCGEFFFYLEITSSIWQDEYTTERPYGTNDAAIAGTKQRSDIGMMAAMAAYADDDIAAVTGVKDDKLNAIILGCEAANRSSSDYDYNDIVFLMVGNSTPTILESFDRRYLCEDLGSTYDFDFNDIVVDVKQRQDVTSKFTLDTSDPNYKGTWERSLSNKTQSVSIAHMCGTIPFQVYVGNTDKSQAGFCFPVLTNPNIVDRKTNGYTPTSSKADVSTYCLSASMATDAPNWWDPKNNNIYIDVWPYGNETTEGGASTVMHTVAFSEDDPGTIDSDGYSPQATKKAPQMIAVDPTVNWMGEHVHIPTSWVNAAKTLDIKNETTTSSSETTGD